MAGLELDPWQQWVMEQSCAQKEDTFFNDHTGETQRKWAARDVGLVVARQNGKGSILEARELAGLFLFGEKTIIHSAQDFATSGEHYRRVESLIRNCPELHAEVKGYYESNGKERIELHNGARLLFKTRTKKLGRGFSPQLVVLDEAMFLDGDAMAALLPTVSAQENPQFWFTGSAGDKDSTEFGRVRARGVSGSDPTLFFAEWSIDACDEFCPRDCREHDRMDDVESFAKANPGLGIRITIDTCWGEYRQLSEEKFKQERLSVGDWPVEGDQWAVIPEEKWKARTDEYSTIRSSSPFVLAVDTSPDRSFSCITSAGHNDEGMTHVEITTDGEQYDHRPGVDWVVEAIKEMYRVLKPDGVVIDKQSQAGSFIPELEAADIRIISPNAAEYAQACGELYSAVCPRRGEKATLVHLGQEPLTWAVAGADKRDLADKWAWSKRDSSSDISPLVSATLAAWGFRRVLHEKPEAVTPWMFRR